MKQFKKVFLLLMIFMLTGCTTVCNLTINSDNTIDLEVQVKEDYDLVNSEIAEDESNWDELVKQIPIRKLNEYKQKYPEFNLSYNTDYSNYYGNANVQFNDFESLKKSQFLNTVFTNNTFLNNNGIYTINLSMMDEEILKAIKSYNNFVTINIRLPYYVMSSNATSVNSINNIYTWNLSEEIDTINIKYDSNRSYIEKSDENKKEKDNIVIVLCALVGALVIIGIGISIKNRYQK